MEFSITPLYGVAVATIWLALWMRVTAMRAGTGQSIGHGGDRALLLRIRQHGNCQDWASFVLILMILAEGSGAQGSALHLSGALLVLGRILHPLGLKIDNASHPLRYLGNGTNILAVLVLGGVILAGFVAG